MVAANLRPSALCRALWFLSWAGPTSHTIPNINPTSSPNRPIPISQLCPRPWNLDRSDTQAIDQLVRIVKNGISHINGILAISGRHVLESDGVGRKLLKGTFWFGANWYQHAPKNLRGTMRRSPPTIPAGRRDVSLRRKSW